jgi:hypothetical protein
MDWNKDIIIKETENNDLPEINIGDIIVFSPDSELTLSTDDSIVPKEWVNNGVWFADSSGIDGSINVNCGNHPEGAGMYCSYGNTDDITKIIRVDSNDPKRKQKVIWEKQNTKSSGKKLTFEEWMERVEGYLGEDINEFMDPDELKDDYDDGTISPREMASYLRHLNKE